MLTQRLHQAGLRAWHMQWLSLASVGLCVVLWIRAKTVDQDERGNAIWLIGDSLERQE
jgi:hypothetical protein